MRRAALASLALLIGVPMLRAQDKKAPPGPVVGKVAPDIRGKDLDGKKFKLSDYRGKVVLLDFWGNW